MGTVKYTGPVASFHCPTNAEIRSLKVHFSPKQEGTGNSSPENVRPIVGWDGVGSKESSKNLFDSSKASCSHPSTSWNASTETDDMIFANGELSGTVQSGWRDVTVFSQNISFAPGTYTLSFDYINGIKNYSWRPVIITATYSGWFTAYKSIPSATQDSGHIETTFTADKQFYVAICLNSFGYAATTAKNKIYNIQLELGSIATSFEPCKISITDYEFGVLGKNKLNADAEQQAPDNTNMMPTNKRIFTPNTYCVGMSWSNYYTPNNVTSYSVSNGTITVTNGNVYGLGYPVCVRPSQTYFLSATTTNGRAHIAYFASDGTYISGVSTDILNKSFTVPNDVNIAVIVFFSASGEATFSNIQLELGSTATAYEPYDPNHTVYGGWVDLITGEVREEKVCITIDGTQTIQVRETYTNANAFRIAKSQLPIVPLSYSEKDLSSHLQVALATDLEANQQKPWSFYVNSGNHSIFLLFPKSYTSVTNVQNFFVEHPTQISYTITPNTYYLAPTELQTFLGQNNVWSNADYVEVEYDLHETQDILARKQFIIASQPHLEEVSESIATFNTDLKAPLKECKIHFNPIQEGSGDPSPDNVRPITGWTGLSLYHSEGNLYTPNPNNKGYISSSGVINVDTTSTYTDLIPIVVGDTYTFRCTTASVNGNTNRRIHGYDSSGNWVKQLTVGTTAANIVEEKVITTTIPSGISYIRVSFRNQDTNVRIAREDVYDIQWGNEVGTIYGGYVDLKTGEVWKTYHHMTIDKNSRVGIFPWMGTRTDDTTGLEYTGVLWRRETNDPKVKGYNDLICYCDSYPYHTLGSSTRVMNSAGMYDGDTYGPSLFLPTSEVGTTSESLAAFMEDKTFNFIYLMREPQLIETLTPTQLKTLRGTNNVWSNAGNITLSYWKH